MAKHGSIGEYNESTEDWTAYAERLDHYLLANDVEDAAKQRAVLLSICGPSTYRLIRSLVAPGKPTDRSYEELKELVKVHYNPRPSAIVERFRFNSRVRQSGETIAKFVASLRQLSEHCEFGGTLDAMLRDRIVCGIGDARIQRRLLSEPELTFERALTLAQAMELADRDTKDLQLPSTESPAQVHNLEQKKSPTQWQTKSALAPCYRCGGKHLSSQCRFRDAECHACGKTGHIAKVCRSKKGTPGKRQAEAAANATLKIQDERVETPEYMLFPVTDQQAEPLRTTVTVNNKELVMEVDTGASVSVVSEATYQKLWGEGAVQELHPPRVKLRTYTGQEIAVVGSTTVNVQMSGQVEPLPLTVVGGSGPSLLGRDWLAKLPLDWKTIFNIRTQEGVQGVIDKHADVFKSELGLVKGVTADLIIDSEVQPRFCRARSIPYALRQKVEAELERLVREEVVTPVPFADWAAPIVPVLKSSGMVRICGDYRLTVNKALKPEVYPVPRVEDLFATLARGKAFTKLDLSHAYQQIQLGEQSQKYCTINTHQGLYAYKRLPFGVTSAPAIFQRTMDGLMRGLPKVCVYMDDILVSGTTEQEHLSNLDEVLHRLETAGMRLKRDKCQFLMSEVEYLGHKINEQGIQPTASKVRAIQEAPAPGDVTQLRSFLGLVNYYGKFLANLSTILTPLYKLLRKGVQWVWGDEQKKAFQEVKTLLQSQSLLVHFDGNKPLLLACDASPYGVGAVLSHLEPDGSERPIAFASRTLAAAEQKYSQLDKEALAIVYGVKRFHHYVYGRPFLIASDHKPLISECHRRLRCRSH